MIAALQPQPAWLDSSALLPTSREGQGENLKRWIRGKEGYRTSISSPLRTSRRMASRSSMATATQPSVGL